MPNYIEVNHVFRYCNTDINMIYNTNNRYISKIYLR